MAGSECATLILGNDTTANRMPPPDYDKDLPERIDAVLRSIKTAQSAPARLIAVSKTKSANMIRQAFASKLYAFGENYVQEALAKQSELSDLAIEWHMLGPLQSNKCEAVARHFDWLQSLDRAKLVPLLAAARPIHRVPLQVLIQVNIDDEMSKSGCRPDQVFELATQILTQPKLQLRGLMAIPMPNSGSAAFLAMAALYNELKIYAASINPTIQIDTLSMGMSEDYLVALAHGATMVRIGSGIFGAR
jgi:PLP dependent protein